MPNPDDDKKVDIQVVSEVDKPVPEKRKAREDDEHVAPKRPKKPKSQREVHGNLVINSGFETSIPKKSTKNVTFSPDPIESVMSDGKSDESKAARISEDFINATTQQAQIMANIQYLQKHQAANPEHPKHQEWSQLYLSWCDKYKAMREISDSRLPQQEVDDVKSFVESSKADAQSKQTYGVLDRAKAVVEANIQYKITQEEQDAAKSFAVQARAKAANEAAGRSR